MCGPEEVKMSTTVYRDPDVVVGDNSDALRAVNGLLVNEQSAENKEAALQAISDLHDACESDFQDLCLAQPVSMSMMQVQSLNDAMDNVFDGTFSSFHHFFRLYHYSLPIQISHRHNLTNVVWLAFFFDFCL